ncbi:cell wall galactomannoprotein mp2 allergen f17-like protein [Colletotrichum kahawae]|uniref:Cell wall galactomannoprotein mp2 allergen f17-like protein n=1 Tax=Colletotrichum kahawae TaxID=34407 RepID=A0AAD9XWQ9_COLKA|nr:cell wall galactomannoprotein mp2 allergen f17-like protein [Colletotrichum kahawae]
MLLRSLLSFTLVAATVLAAPVTTTKYKRDLATIQAALNTINSALQGLDNSVKNTQTVTLGGGIQLLGAVGSVKTSIEDATTQVQASEVLNRKDALNLKAATDALTNNVKVTINDVVAKKSLVDSLGATPLVAVALQDQKSASVALAQALVSKVPPELNADAQKSAVALSTVLDQGIAGFGGTSVPPLPGAPGAPPAGASTVCQAVAAPPPADADAAATQDAGAGGGGGGVLAGLMSMFPPPFKKH